MDKTIKIIKKIFGGMFAFTFAFSFLNGFAFANGLDENEIADWWNADTAVHRTGQTLRPSSSGGGGNGAYSYGAYDETIIGIRLSLVDKSGITIESTIDFLKEYYSDIVSGKKDEKYNYNNLYYNNSRCDKLEIVNGNTCRFNKIESEMSDTFGIYTYGELGEIIGSYTPTDFSVVHEVLDKYLTSDVKGSERKQKILNIIKLMTDTSESNRTEEELKDFMYGRIYDRNNELYRAFILYEPIIAVKMKRGTEDKVEDPNEKPDVYVGTPSEILEYFSKEDQKNRYYDYNKAGFDEGCKGDGMGSSLCAISQSVYLYASCSSVLDDSLLNVARKTAYSSNFSTGYFNKLPETFTTFEGLCTKNATGRKFMNAIGKPGAGGFGVGIIWLSSPNSVPNGPKCTDVNNYFNIYTTPSCKSVANDLNFNEFNNYYKQNYGSDPNINADWYKVNCGCDNPSKYNCTPKYQLSNCVDGKSIYYKDYNRDNDYSSEEDYWNNCIFNDNGEYDIETHKTSSSLNKGALTYFQAGLGDSTVVNGAVNESDSYCPVYCIEDISAMFAKNNDFTVQAGRFFTLPNSQVSGSRTCKTKYVDWDQFEDDLKKAKAEVAQAYVDYMASTKQDGDWRQTEGGDTTKTEYGTYAIRIVTEEEAKDWDCFNNFVEENGEKKCYTHCFTEGEHGSCVRKLNDHICDSYDEANSGHCTYKVKGKKWVWSSTYEKIFEFDGKKYIGKYEVEKTQDDKPTYKPSGLNTDKINDAINKMEGYIDRISNCYNWNITKEGGDNLYNLNPQAWINYNVNPYNLTGEEAKLEIANSESDITDNNEGCRDESISKFSYEDGKLKSENTKITVCDTVSRTKNTTLTYKLRSDLYQYISKFPNNNYTVLSVNKNGLISGKNYIDVGFGNLPVPFNTEPDKYQYTIGYVNLGHDKDYSIEANKDTAVDTILMSVDNNGTYKSWTCNYEVTKGLIIPPGIDVIYREIDLEKPFPDIDGSNRSTGQNWCSRESCAWDNRVSYDYILNNRNVKENNPNVKASEIYNKEPMYSFKMTPSDIIQIRRYNDKNDYTAYTGSLDGVNYDFTCKTGTGEACISGYLTHLMELMETSEYPGTCKDSLTRSYKDVSAFNNCRY